MTGRVFRSTQSHLPTGYSLVPRRTHRGRHNWQLRTVGAVAVNFPTIAHLGWVRWHVGTVNLSTPTPTSRAVSFLQETHVNPLAVPRRHFLDELAAFPCLTSIRLLTMFASSWVSLPCVASALIHVRVTANGVNGGQFMSDSTRLQYPTSLRPTGGYQHPSSGAGAQEPTQVSI